MLKVDGLKFSFRERPLFDRVSFHVRPGGLLRLAGPNGAGKSTFMAILAGLLDGYHGTITFEGDTEDFRDWTAWLPADANALHPSLDAVSNLKFWCELRGLGISDELISQKLDTWGLKGKYLQEQLSVSRFSTGMRRRLAIARLELSQAKLWLIDEPLFGLDDSACTQFRESLKQHLAANGAAVVITHDERLLTGIAHETIALGVAK